jgi:hypothetical protein
MRRPNPTLKRPYSVRDGSKLTSVIFAIELIDRDLCKPTPAKVKAPTGRRIRYSNLELSVVHNETRVLDLAVWPIVIAVWSFRSVRTD